MPSHTIKIRLCLAVVWCYLVVIFYWQLNDLWLDRTSRTVAAISRISLIWHPFSWPELRRFWVWEVGLGTWEPFFTSLFPKTGLLAVSWQGLGLSISSSPHPVPGESDKLNLSHQVEDRSQLSSYLLCWCILFLGFIAFGIPTLLELKNNLPMCQGYWIFVSSDSWSQR